MNKRGFTLIELLIVIVLTGMIFTGVSALVATLFNTNTRSQQIDVMEQSLNDIQNELTNLVKWAKTVEIVSPQTIRVTMHDDPTPVEIGLDGERIVKDGQSLHSENVRIVSFVVNDRTQSGSAEKSLEFVIELQHMQLDTVQDRATIVASQRSAF